MKLLYEAFEFDENQFYFRYVNGTWFRCLPKRVAPDVDNGIIKNKDDIECLENMRRYCDSTKRIV